MLREVRVRFFITEQQVRNPRGSQPSRSFLRNWISADLAPEITTMATNPMKILGWGKLHSIGAFTIKR
jgi:hypothetical protein